MALSGTLSQVIHPRLHQELPQFFPAYVTVQIATESQGDDNAVVENWANVDGLAGLRGTLAPASANETRKAELTNVKITHVLDLRGYYPTITITHRVLVSRAQGDSPQIFNITAVKHDSQAESSHLELEQVSW